MQVTRPLVVLLLNVDAWTKTSQEILLSSAKYTAPLAK